MIVWVKSSVLSGTVVSKQEERRLMKIPKVDVLPRHHIDAVRDLILRNRCLTISDIAEDVGISFGSCQAILTEKLNMHCIATKFVPRVLTEDQKAN